MFGADIYYLLCSLCVSRLFSSVPLFEYTLFASESAALTLRHVISRSTLLFATRCLDQQNSMDRRAI